MNYDIVTLGDVCEFLDSQRVPITESDRKPGPYPYYGANGQQDSIDSYIFDEPLVLLAEDGGYFGSKDRPIAYKVTGKCWVNNHAHVLRPKSNIDVDYLHRVLSYYDVTKYVNGTTRQKLTKGNAENISFPLPPLTEQKRIASLLARADRLRGMRRTAHELGESLLQSVFLEMFGDPKTNPKKWDFYELGEIVEINPTGRPKANPEQATSFLPMTLVDPSHIYSDTLDIKRFDEVAKGYTYFEENDVLFAKITPCMENGNIVIAKNLLNGFGFGSTEFHVIRPNERANATWLYGFVKRPEFREEATRWFRGTAGQQRVPSDFLESCRVPLPPLSLQEEFAGVVARVESLRGRMSEAERQVEGLFESLLAEAFHG
jgi:type I restriction enzyme S subunit